MDDLRKRIEELSKETKKILREHKRDKEKVEMDNTQIIPLKNRVM